MQNDRIGYDVLDQVPFLTFQLTRAEAKLLNSTKFAVSNVN